MRRRQISDRPIRRSIVKRLPIERPPRIEFLTPRLNAGDPPDQIGFVHHFARDDDDEWEDDIEECPQLDPMEYRKR